MWKSAQSKLKLTSVAVVCVSACVTSHSLGLQTQAIDSVPRTSQLIPGGGGDWASAPGRLVKITFKAEPNLRAAKNAGHLHVRFKAWLCSDKHRLLSFLPIVYDDVGALDDQTVPESSTSQLVWIYVAEASPERTDIETGAKVPSYDLRQGNQDLCVQILARNMALQGFESKVIRIPAATLAEKIR